VQTPYMVMSVRANQARKRYNLSAGIFAWLTLAGYVVLPNTFTSIQKSEALDKSEGGKVIQNTVRNIQILPFASIFCGVGTIGMGYLWWRFRRNYIWLLAHIVW
jgi:hypothetical protein